MRDHRQLTAFVLAHRYAVEVYRATNAWPKSEQFELTSQVRCAAVSVSSNLVEGCSRDSDREYKRFVEAAFGSAREAKYQLQLAKDFGFDIPESLTSLAEECCRVLYGLNLSLGAKR